MLNEFQEQLNADKALILKNIPHFIRWVRDCYSFFRQPPTERLSFDQIHHFLTHLEKTRENWQVKQAEQALRRFDFFLAMKSRENLPFRLCNHQRAPAGISRRLAFYWDR